MPSIITSKTHRAFLLLMQSRPCRSQNQMEAHMYSLDGSSRFWLQIGKLIFSTFQDFSAVLTKHSQSPHSIMLRTNWPWLSPHSCKFFSKTPGFQEGLQSRIGSSTFSRPPDCFDIGHSWSWWSSKVCKPDWDINLRKGREPVGSKNPRLKSAFQNVWSAKSPLSFPMCLEVSTYAWNALDQGTNMLSRAWRYFASRPLSFEVLSFRESPSYAHARSNPTPYYKGLT